VFADIVFKEPLATASSLQHIHWSPARYSWQTDMSATHVRTNLRDVQWMQGDIPHRYRRLTSFERRAATNVSMECPAFISTDKNSRMVSAVHQRNGGRGIPSRQRLHPRIVESSQTPLREPQTWHLPPTLRLFLVEQTAGLFRYRQWKSVAVGTGPEQTHRHVWHILSRVPTETSRNELPPVTMSVCPSPCNNYFILEAFLVIPWHIPTFVTIGHFTWKLRTFLRASRAEMTKYSSKRRNNISNKHCRQKWNV
jgi:hypothetical protein